jgi:hypothetical protein
MTNDRKALDMLFYMSYARSKSGREDGRENMKDLLNS